MPSLFLVELGAAMSVASTALPSLSIKPCSLSKQLTLIRTPSASLCFFQPVAKSEDGALLKQASMRVQLGKLAVQQHVKKGFLHRRLRQAMRHGWRK